MYFEIMLHAVTRSSVNTCWSLLTSWTNLDFFHDAVKDLENE